LAEKVTERSPLVERLGLQPHVEGGWFKEMWRTAQNIPQSALGAAYSGDRSAATSVYFLLHPGEESAWHKVTSDELWLWHSGSPIVLTLGGSGDEPGEETDLILGVDWAAGQEPQGLVPGGVWQKARPLSDEPGLCTCIVAPGFHFDDFQLVKK